MGRTVSRDCEDRLMSSPIDHGMAVCIIWSRLDHADIIGVDLWWRWWGWEGELRGLLRGDESQQLTCVSVEGVSRLCWRNSCCHRGLGRGKKKCEPRKRMDFFLLGGDSKRVKKKKKGERIRKLMGSCSLFSDGYEWIMRKQTHKVALSWFSYWRGADIIQREREREIVQTRSRARLELPKLNHIIISPTDIPFIKCRYLWFGSVRFGLSNLTNC